MDALFAELIAKLPGISQILMVVGILRIVVKPIFSAYYAFVSATPSTKDDEFYKKIDESPVKKSILFVLDWLGSIKLKV